MFRTPYRSAILGLSLFGGLCVTQAAFADYLWLERSGASVQARLSEFQPSEHLALGKLLEPQLLLADGKSTPLAVAGDALRVEGGGAGDLRVTAKHAEGSKLTIYEAREGRHETRAANDLELVPTTPDGNTFKLHWKGTVVAASQVNVYTSEQWSRTLKPAADGSVTLDTPFPARYVLEVAAEINGAATVDGKRYDRVTHVATLSFEVK
ncbi:hypothetical protein [Zestomonas carbonaria]|uniref:DUF4198 domain-containing protein n=1 Tax=Zestomonas carbonaria TaxID=2762745 RepID=A0A7U7ESX4_9GAMM|nr:hypothetical protein [Pseudomonas carbonaria]CAD5110553.1 hypothetical protein PSEWESI4_04876 [Pseudomonas carbonaria]